MAVELATAYVSIVPSARGLSQAIHKELVGPTGRVAGDAGHAAGTSFGNRFSGAVRSIATVGALGLAGLAVGATKLVIDAVGAAEEARKVAQQTNAVIQSTGAVAGVSARDVDRLAGALSAKAGIDDELIQSGANVLLTFTKVRNEVGLGNDIFNQATGVALDMSVALGQDLQSSVVQIGKALNDPIRGITALQRVGVAFTEQQKEQIRTLVESGDVLGAQKIILQELTTEFGGSAEAQATASDRLKVAFGNVSEAIGGVLLPYVDQFSQWMLNEGVPLLEERLVPAIGDLAEWISTKAVPAIRDELLPRLGDLVTWIRDNVLPPLGTMGTILVDDIVPAIQDAATWIGDHLVPALEKLVPNMEDANEEAGKSPSWLGWAVAIGAAALAIAAIASAVAGVVSGVVGAAKAVGIGILLVGRIVVGGVLFLIGPLFLFPALIAGIAIAIVRNFGTIRDGIVGAVTGIVDFMTAQWRLLGPIMLGPVAMIADAIGISFGDIWGAITGTVTAVLDFVGRNWPLLVAIMLGPVGLIVYAVARNWETIIGAFQTGASWVIGIWTRQWDLMVGIVQTSWQLMYNVFVGIPSAIAGVFINASQWLLEGGRNIMRGLRSGIEEVWGGILEWFRGLPSRVLGALGISSPPQWAIDAGKWILRGITKGLGLGVGSVMEFMSGLASRFTGPLRDAWSGLTRGSTAAGQILAGAGSFRPGAGVEQWRQLALAALAYTGSPASWIDSLLRRMAQESGGNPNAINLWDINAARGDPSRGLMQTIGATFSRYAGELVTRGIFDPFANIVAAIRYTVARYGTGPAGWNRPGGYAAGGVLPYTGMFYGHRGETVFNRDQLRVLGAVIGQGAAGAGGPSVYIGNITIEAETEAGGRAAGRGFLDTLAERRILTDARIA